VRALEGMLLMVFSVHWFLKILKEKQVRYPAQTFAFWMCTGILIYYAGNLVLFLFSSFVMQQKAVLFKAIWEVHAILVIFLYLTYTVGFLCVNRTPKSS